MLAGCTAGTPIAYINAMRENLLLPEPGDLLVSRPTASADYEVSVFGNGKCVTHGRGNLAIGIGRELAERLTVDLWITEDHNHFQRLAAHRGYDGPRLHPRLSR